MKKILIKLPKKVYVEDLDREVFLGKFEKYFVKDDTKTFSDKRHAISSEELSKEPHKFEVNGFEYFTLEPDFLDEYKRLRRLAQIITLKDLGRIITLLGLTKDSVFVEAGSGSGAASKYFGNIVKEVHSYEVNEEHLAVAKENTAELDNVTFYAKDIYDETIVLEHEADGFLLDVPDPKKALKSVIRALRMGGRAVIYTPNLTQAQETVLNLPDELLYEGTVELTQRDWHIRDKVLRPRMQGLGHTAFLTTVRKIPK